MRTQWPLAERCYAALTTLHEELQQSSSGRDRALTPFSDLGLRSDSGEPPSETTTSQLWAQSRKRPRSPSDRSSGQIPLPSRDTDLLNSASSIYVNQNRWNVQPSTSSTLRPSNASTAHKRDLELGNETSPVRKIGATDSFDIFQDISWETLFDFTNSYT